MDQPIDKKPEIAHLKWPIEDKAPYYYANQFALYKTGQEAVLIFGRFMPTGFANRSKEEIEKYLQSAEVEPLAKIVISHDGLKALVGLLNRNIGDKGETTDG